MNAFLVLQDGTICRGEHIGADKEVFGEIVCNTSMAGYPEILTDPAYAGQVVCMTYPLIGNYGICEDDLESGQAWPEGIVIKELSRIASNFRSDIGIQDYLKEQGIAGIAGIDTRTLTKHLRNGGTQNCCITTRRLLSGNAEDMDGSHPDPDILNDILSRLKSFPHSSLVNKVTCKETRYLKGAGDLSENGPRSGSACFNEEDYRNGIREKVPGTIRQLNGRGKRIAVLDLGLKRSVAAALTMRGCDVTVYTALTAAGEILAGGYDGILLSGGPGDPGAEPDMIAEIRKIYEGAGAVPVFAIGLGHQLLALAAGGEVIRMKYGHRGSNQPVKELATGRVFITSQNHGYVVNGETMEKTVALSDFIQVNDGTCEGLRYANKPFFSVQFEPEQESWLYDRFLRLMDAPVEGTKEESKNA